MPQPELTLHGSWRYHKITAARLHDDLAGLAAKLARPSWLASWAAQTARLRRLRWMHPAPTR
jgi:hypothetical protein